MSHVERATVRFVGRPSRWPRQCALPRPPGRSPLQPGRSRHAGFFPAWVQTAQGVGSPTGPSVRSPPARGSMDTTADGAGVPDVCRFAKSALAKLVWSPFQGTPMEAALPEVKDELAVRSVALISPAGAKAEGEANDTAGSGTVSVLGADTGSAVWRSGPCLPGPKKAAASNARNAAAAATGKKTMLALAGVFIGVGFLQTYVLGRRRPALPGVRDGHPSCFTSHSPGSAFVRSEGFP
jgi:hypothetical protein